MAQQERFLYIVFSLMLFAFALAGILHQGPVSALHGLLAVQKHSARLISDFTVVGGAGGALLNAALVGAIGLFLVFITGVRLAGPTIAAVLTIAGFGLFGKTPINILPIMAGVFVSGRIIGKPFSAYILIALFGTALGPLVTFLVYESGLTGSTAVISGIAAGLAAGMILPPIAMAMLHLHQGYNLYNIGLTCGFFGLFAAGILSASRRDLTPAIVWNSEPSLFLAWLVPAFCLALLAAGASSGRKNTLKHFLLVQKIPGRLPSDFVDMVSSAGALVNMGLLGLAGCVYVAAVGGDFNGPVIGGLMTLIGFGSFGKNLRNSWPIVAGVVLACLVFGKNLSAPGPLLAALFSTTLAPLAGQFGIALGIAAGFLHLTMVERTAAWHGGLDLYNNGFAGGLTAAFLVAIIEWYRTNKAGQ